MGDFLAWAGKAEVENFSGIANRSSPAPTLGDIAKRGRAAMGGGVRTVVQVAAGLAATLALGACGWPGLIAGAISTATSTDQASTNVAIADGVAYVAGSVQGIGRIDLVTGTRTFLAPPAPADRIDDVASADGLVFAL